MKYPKWFPCPGSWLKALALAIPAYLGVMLFPLIFWSALYISIGLTPTPGDHALNAFLFSFSVLLVGLTMYLILTFGYSLLLRLLWSSPPRWLSPSFHWKSLVGNYAIITGATLPVSAMFIFYVSLKTHIKITTGYDLHYIYTDPDTLRSTSFLVHLIEQSIWLWLITAAFLSHFRDSKKAKN